MEANEQRSAADYFIAIIAVLGGALLISIFSPYFVLLAPFLLLLLTPVMLISAARSRQQKHLRDDIYYSQEPVAVSQSSTSSDMCESAPWR
jgi:hypothetical protein